MTFDEVAQRYAPDARSRCSRGYCGDLHRKALHPKLAEAVFSAQPSEVIRPVQVEDRFHLLFVAERIELVLDEAMHRRILKELFSNWSQEQIALVNVCYEA